MRSTMTRLEPHRRCVQRHVDASHRVGGERLGIGAKKRSRRPGVLVGQDGLVRDAVNQSQDALRQIGHPPVGCHVLEVDVQRPVGIVDERCSDTTGVPVIRRASSSGSLV